jgi:putative ABC transport system substrate-binding protein
VVSFGRRGFLAASGALLAAPHVRGRAAALPRVAMLLRSPRDALTLTHLIIAYEEGLRAHGYVHGRNIELIYRDSGGSVERLPEVAQELARNRVDIIVTSTNPHIAAARAATRSIPIVMTVGTGVVEAGFVESLAKPGGNVTGVTWDVGVEMVAKRLELLHEAVPGASRIGVLWHPTDGELPGAPGAMEGVARRLRKTLNWFQPGDDYDGAFTSMVRQGTEALFAFGGSRMWGQRAKVTGLCMQHRLPSSFYDGAFADAGGLMSFAPNLAELYRSAAKYIDRILKGAKPGELSVERPAKLELVVNLKTAGTLGITLPQSLLLRADRLIGGPR